MRREEPRRREEGGQVGGRGRLKNGKSPKTSGLKWRLRLQKGRGIKKDRALRKIRHEKRTKALVSSLCSNTRYGGH